MTVVSDSEKIIKVIRKDNRVTVSRKGAPGGVGPQGVQGLPGPQGIQGPAGDTAVAMSYHHSQNAPSSVWNITHNLGFYPAVSVIDSGGNDAEGDIHYLDDNSLRLTFSSAFGGDAYLS